MSSSDSISMTSNQPYVLSAFYDWIVDNDLTPHLVVDATLPNVHVPQQFVQDGQIVLNVSPSACVNFALGPEGLSFQARFGGQPHLLSMPCHAVLAIYARENGAGTVFTIEDRAMSQGDEIASAEIEETQSTQEGLKTVLSESEAKGGQTNKAKPLNVIQSSEPPSAGHQSNQPKSKPTLTVVK